MELKHRIALVKISSKNACSAPRKRNIEQYLIEHPEIPRDEVRALIPFTGL